MRKILAALAACMWMGGAFAADLSLSPAEPNLTDIVQSLQKSGVYVSVAGGTAFTDANATAAGASPSVAFEGWRANTRIGYDRYYTTNWLLGLYGEAGWGHVTGSAFDLSSIAGLTYGAGGKVGYSSGAGTLYGLVGWEGSEVSVNGKSSSVNGLKLGAGIEYTIGSHLYVFSEYDWNVDGSYSPVAGLKINQDTGQALAGLGWKF